MIPHYRIHLPLVAIEGRAISVDGGTGVSAMIALAYVRAWSAEATVAIYPSGHRALVGRAELVAADAMLVRARACGARVLRVDAPSIAGALAAATVVYADAAALCALARAAQPALMALIDELVPAIDTAREDAALARVQRGTAPLDLDLDILARCPHLMDDHATPARLLGTRRPALRARPGAAHDRTAGALESA